MKRARKVHSRRFVLALLLPVLVCLPGCIELLVVGGATAAVAAHDRRTVGSLLDDKAIVVKATAAINSTDGPKEDVHINLTSVNGVVLLTGEAPTAESHDKVLAAVRTVAGVRRTVNEIRVAPLSTSANRARDTWLTSKAKTTLVGVKGLDSSQVKVITENATVYLMGMVTKAEADSAATAVADVSGVERVVKLFEYID